jgi:hypothetical protein
VHRDTHVQVEGAFYSVPWRYVTRAATVRVERERISIFVGDELVASHVPQVDASPRLRSAGVSLTRPQAPVCPSWFPPAASRSGVPFPPRGPVGHGSPASAVLRDAPTPCRPARPPSFSFDARGPWCIVNFAPPAPRCGRRRPGGHDAAPPTHGRPISTATTGPPRFLGNPFGCVPRCLTPVGRRCSADCHTSDGAFRHSYDVGPTTIHYFRSSITRPAPSLSTLRPTGCPDRTQDSLPAASARLGRAGLDTRWASLRGFRSGHDHPPRPDFAWRTGMF